MKAVEELWRKFYHAYHSEKIGAQFLMKDFETYRVYIFKEVNRFPKRLMKSVDLFLFHVLIVLRVPLFVLFLAFCPHLSTTSFSVFSPSLHSNAQHALTCGNFHTKSLTTTLQNWLVAYSWRAPGGESARRAVAQRIKPSLKAQVCLSSFVSGINARS